MLSDKTDNYILIEKRKHTAVIYSRITGRSYVLLIEKDEKGDEYLETRQERLYIKDFEEKGQKVHNEDRDICEKE